MPFWLSGLLILLLSWPVPAQDALSSTKDSDETCDASGGGSCKSDKTDNYGDIAQCEDWARKCECQSNPTFMMKSCGRSCDLHGRECKNKRSGCKAFIGKVKIGARCSEDQWKECASTCMKMATANEDTTRKNKGKCKRVEVPGGLQEMSIPQMFGRIADEGWASQHEPKVLSRDPWVVYFDKLLTEEQIDIYMAGMEEIGATFEGSTELSSSASSNNRRTSDSMHCPNPKCFLDPRLLEIHKVITNVTGLGLNAHELPQIVRYRDGQFYVQHQDTSNDYGKAGHGNRIYTMFIYLSDLPDGAEGETHFPKLGIKVKPKKGAATLWTNVIADNPRQVELRTNHESLPVREGAGGTKIAGNFWLYGYDWRTLWKGGCMNVDAGF